MLKSDGAGPCRSYKAEQFESSSLFVAHFAKTVTFLTEIRTGIFEQNPLVIILRVATQLIVLPILYIDTLNRYFISILWNDLSLSSVSLKFKVDRCLA